MKKIFALLTASLLSASLLSTATAAPITITVLHTNDTHAHLEPSKVGANNYGGVTRMSTLVKQYQAQDINPIFIHGGDTFQGTLFYNLYKGQADVAFWNRLNTQAMAIGNHEFDDGPAPLAAYIKKAHFPVLSANIDVSAEPLLADLVKPYTVITVGGEKIGIIGATTPDLPQIANIGDKVKMKDLLGSIQQAVSDLKAQGINKIILDSHVGYTVDQDIAAKISDIDLIIDAHSHTLLGEDGTWGEVANKDFPKVEGPYPTVVGNAGGKTLIVSDWEWGKLLGRIQLKFDDAGVVTEYSGKPIVVSQDVPEDVTARKMLDTLSVPLNALKKQVVGNTSTGLDGSREIVRQRESTMGNVLADAALEAGSKAGAVIGLVNGGGVRASIDKGPITYEEAITVQPFGNTLTLLDLTGAQIKQALEYGVATWADNKGQFLHVSKGMQYTFDLSKPAGQRLVSATLGGQPLDDNKTYRVAINTFSAKGGDGFEVFKNANAYRLDTGLIDMDVLVNYLKAHPDAAMQNEGRIVIVNEPKK